MFTPIGLDHYVFVSYCNGIVRTENDCFAVAKQIPDSARETPISTIIVRVKLMFHVSGSLARHEKRGGGIDIVMTSWEFGVFYEMNVTLMQ